MIRRRYPLVARLERVDRELSDSVRFFGILTEDIIGARGMAIDAAERLTGVVALVGCLLLVAGADSRLVGPWLIAMAADGAVEEADRIGGRIVEQLMLLHGMPAGEA